MRTLLIMATIIFSNLSFAGAKNDYVQAEKKYENHYNGPRGLALLAIKDSGFELGDIQSFEIEEYSGQLKQFVVYVTDDSIACRAILFHKTSVKPDHAICYIK